VRRTLSQIFLPEIGGIARANDIRVNIAFEVDKGDALVIAYVLIVLMYTAYVTLTYVK
jgi:hypothetical protein